MFDTGQRISEEEVSTPAGLLRVCIFAAFGFAGMALLVDDKAVPLFIGGGIIAAVVTFGLWLRFQRRYGSATLEVITPFVYGGTFSGVIQTELKTAGKGSIRILVAAGSKIARNRGDYFGVRQKVLQSQLQRTENGDIRIPFSLEIPAHTPREYDEVRLEARTSTWPVGWGATFVIVASAWVPIIDDIISE
jgi:hypothetical protein